MTTLEMSKAFLLSNDLIEARSWQLWVEINGTQTQILQVNQTNPRIKKLSAKQVGQLMNITQSMPEYEARVVKDALIEPLISSRFRYFICFDGVSRIAYDVAAIEESQQQDVYWRLILARV